MSSVAILTKILNRKLAFL